MFKFFNLQAEMIKRSSKLNFPSHVLCVMEVFRTH